MSEEPVGFTLMELHVSHIRMPTLIAESFHLWGILKTINPQCFIKIANKRT